MAMLEALAAGVPVLAADSGGAVDIIREGVNGRLHRTGDAAALTAQLSDWLVRPPVFDVAAIRRTAVPIERVAAQWRRIYTEL
jgi:glycosyltransferase involved in cell wall biosynthesis